MSELCSIIIPVRNRAGLTRQCLDAVLAEPPDAPFEIVVVDDGSTDFTPELLAGYAPAIRVVRRDTNAGFAVACNEGAAAAAGEYLLFLNNDTIPQRGWLDALVVYAEHHPKAAIVGSKLLFPNETIQHAGVVVGHDGYPHHLYAGFPADHPAVDKSRAFPAVTLACALVRREPFEQVGPLNTEFRNSFEDVDICMRMWDAGHEVHYCHESVVYHLESVSRGRRSEDDVHNSEVLRSRWAHRLKPNDFDYYVQDGLLKVSYPESYPQQWEISPLLALDSRAGHMDEAERLLDARSREVFNLLKETVRLTAHIADLELGLERQSQEQDQTPPPEQEGEVEKTSTHDEVFARVQSIELEIYLLQQQLEAVLREARENHKGPRGEPFTRSEYLEHLNRQDLLKKMRESVSSTLPGGALVLVVSGGDDELLQLNWRKGLHFPQDDKGIYRTLEPAGDAAAIEHLEALRSKGAQYLVFPVTALWWLDRYPEFRQHLERHYETVAQEDGACLIFALSPP
jgi:GT2 family glycosyltransferase